MGFPICPYYTVRAHLLQQHGEVGHEPEDAAVSDGAQRHWCNAEYIHTFGTGGCNGRAETDGGAGGCQEGTGGERER